MQVNSIQNTAFGQIFVSQPMKQKIQAILDTMPEEKKQTRDTFIRNWKRCHNTKQFDLLIEDNEKVFLLDKRGQRVMEETLLEKFIWNIDTAIKRILLFEDANTDIVNRKISKYD